MARVPLISESFRFRWEDAYLIMPDPYDGSSPLTWERWVPQTPEDWDVIVEDLVDLWNNFWGTGF
jgi:hypothetical protein